jgi:hypothetical protein
MTYFPDLSDYAYSHWSQRPGTKNVGWLARTHDFHQSKLSEELLDLIWDYCTISVTQTRGLHSCEFCSHDESDLTPPVIAERNGQKLLLGSAEIRVFSRTGDIYATPDLIYHYVSVHNYSPPEEFLIALGEGPKPPNQDFFEHLSELDLKWHRKPPPDPAPRFRFVKTADGIVRKEIVRE